MIKQNQVAQVAIECLHQDHLDVVELLNQLLADLAGKSDAGELTTRFNSLIEHCANHFFCEERQMRKYNFPALEAHQAEHQRIVAEVTAVQQQWHSTADRQQLNHYLSETFTPWLLDHIQGVDVEASQFIYDAGGR